EHLVHPRLKLAGVHGDAALEDDGVVFGTAGKLEAGRRVAAGAVLYYLGGALEPGDLADAEYRRRAAGEPGLEHEVLVRVHGFGSWHFRRPSQVCSCPASCSMWMITNSAGLSGAKPTRMLTMPLSISLCGLFSLSHLTR